MKNAIWVVYVIRTAIVTFTKERMSRASAQSLVAIYQEASTPKKIIPAPSAPSFLKFISIFARPFL